MARLPPVIVTALALMASALATAGPTRAEPTFTLDGTSPTLGVIPATAADILNPAPGSPFWNPGVPGMNPPPTVVLSGAVMGLPPGAAIDDFSFGNDLPTGPLALAYSVNRTAAGYPLAGNALRSEATLPEQAVGGDVYTPSGQPLVANCGLAAPTANTLLTDGDGTRAGSMIDSWLRLSLGLDELHPLALQDNVSGLELQNFAAPPVFFTVDAPAAALLGLSPADILAWFGGPGWVVWAPADALGLMPWDEVDALAVADAVKDGLPIGPGDSAVFSLKAGQFSLNFLPHCPGSPFPGPASPGDLWLSDGAGDPAPFVDAEMLGLATVRSGTAPVDDDLDALDFVTFSGVDTDGDGADNAVDFDDDGDSLSDSREAALGTNPLVADTDTDGIIDGFEAVVYGTDPLNPDTDDDGYATAGAAPYRYGDGWEAANGEHPLAYCGIMRADVDSDGVVSILDLSRVSMQYNQTVPPAPARLDQFPPRPQRDNSINILDLSYQAGRYLQNVAACP